MKRILLALLLGVTVACNQVPVGPADPGSSLSSTAIDAFGANPNPSPANVGTQFSWTVFGRDLVCKLDVEGDGTTDYTVQSCTSQSRVIHTYGTQGSFDARLTVTGADGKTLQKTTPVSVSAPNTPPSIPSLTPAPPPSSREPLAVQFTWVVADFDADVTRCKFDAESDGVWDFDDLCSGLPATSAVGKAATTSFTYTHKYGKNGRYEATLEAADPYVATQTKVKVRVPWNRLPAIKSLKAVAGANNSATVSFAVSDPDDDPLSCKLTVETIGTFNYPNCRNLTRSYSFAGYGTYRVTLEATDPYQGKVTQQTAVVFGPPQLVRVTSGNDHSCALLSNGDAYCWGSNKYGQLGNATNAGNSSAAHPVPAKVVGGQAFTSLVAHEDHTCGLTATGQAYCWGKNSKGQLGSPQNAGTFGVGSYTPLLVAGGHTFVQIDTGNQHVCGLTAAGDVYCWGYNLSGQLGNNVNVGSYGVGSATPVLVGGGHTFSSLGVGNAHTCGITASGDVYCWGNNEYGQLGQVASYDPQATPLLLTGSETFVYLTGGAGNTCGLTASGAAFCWGLNYYGNLGNPTNAGTFDPNTVPLPVDGGHTFVQLEAHNGVTCGVTSAGEGYCWGFNAQGSLGNAAGLGNSGLGSYTPVPVDGGHTFAQIHPGNNHTCGTTVDRQAYCWGGNNMGRLGSTININTVEPNPLPLLVPAVWLQ